jgi:hypothetical protein
MLAYKFLRRGATGPFSGYRWPLPEGTAPGAWVDAGGPIATCATGVHACRAPDLAWWLSDELWSVELGGEIVAEEHTVVATRGRLLGRVDAWTPQVASDLIDVLAARCRDRAVTVLRDTSLARDAGRLAAATRTATMQRAAEQAEVAAERAGSGFAAIAAGYAADAAWCAGDRLVRVAIDTAGRLAQHVTGDPGADVTERAWCSRWLGERLGIA